MTPSDIRVYVRDHKALEEDLVRWLKEHAYELSQGKELKVGEYINDRDVDLVRGILRLWGWNVRVKGVRNVGDYPIKLLHVSMPKE